MKQRLPLFKPIDFLVIAILLSVSVMFIVSPMLKRGQTKRLMLLNGDNATELSWQDQTLNLIDITGKNMTVEVSGARARVLSSDCPNQVCVHIGWISGCGEVAACVPNTVAIYIECSGQ